MSHRDRDRHRRGRWRDWDDWRYFGLPYLAPQLAPQYAGYAGYGMPLYTRSLVTALPAYNVFPPGPPVLPATQTIQQVVLPSTAMLPAGAGIAGTYRVVAPMGLNLRVIPDVYSTVVAVLRPGMEVQVVGPAGPSGWVRTSDGRYLCMSCAEGGSNSGPWLVRSTAQFALAAPSSNATFFGQDLANPGAAGVLMDLGFRKRKIRGHKTRTVIARPDVTIFQPLTLFIPHDTAKHFDIREIRVGNKSYLASRHGVPAERYECNGGVAIQLPPLLAGQPAFLKVKNRSGSSHTIRASFTGLAV